MNFTRTNSLRHNLRPLAFSTCLVSALALAGAALGRTDAPSISGATPAVSIIAAVAPAKGKFSEIVHRVEAATTPAADYSAKVHHTVTKASPVTAQGVTPAPRTVLAEEDYIVNGTRSGAVRAKSQLSSKRTEAAVPVADSAGRRKINGGLMTVNPLNALHHVAGMSAIEIADETWQGEACDKVTGTDPHYQIVLWVSKKAATIQRLTVQRDAILLFDTTITYQNWNGSLVPAHVEITKPSNGITMIEDFSDHSL